MPQYIPRGNLASGFCPTAINPFAQRRDRLKETTVSGEGRDKVLLLDISRLITGMERKRGEKLVQQSIEALVQVGLVVRR